MGIPYKLSYIIERLVDWISKMPQNTNASNASKQSKE